MLSGILSFWFLMRSIAEFVSFGSAAGGCASDRREDDL